MVIIWHKIGSVRWVVTVFPVTFLRQFEILVTIYQSMEFLVILLTGFLCVFNPVLASCHHFSVHWNLSSFFHELHMMILSYHFSHFLFSANWINVDSLLVNVLIASHLDNLITSTSALHPLVTSSCVTSRTTGSQTAPWLGSWINLTRLMSVQRAWFLEDEARLGDPSHLQIRGP